MRGSSLPGCSGKEPGFIRRPRPVLRASSISAAGLKSFLPASALPTPGKRWFARAAGRPVFAVGTTVVRALEDSAQRAAEAGSSNLVVAGKADAHLFIVPGFSVPLGGRAAYKFSSAAPDLTCSCGC